MRLRHSLTALAAGSRLALAEDSCTSADLTIRTTSGTYTGFVDPAVPNVNQWLGIQFGAPPVGADRFMPPKPAPYSGSRDATSYKPICFQQSTIGQGVFWQLVPEFQNVDPQSEDCLYLNIWGPRKPVDAALVPAEKVPVIIWVCGGGFREGGGHAPYQVPDQWIQRTQTHIVITFNYRLNVFGFPGAEAAPYNVGLLDIRLVVEWARDNIAAFGGDPERMVLWGQSAGGGAVDSYAYAHPGNDAIVSGLIADSGAAAQISSRNTTSFSQLASMLNCGNLEGQAELECMQKVDPTEIQKVLQSGAASVPSFGLFEDDLTIFANNTERMEKGLVASVPLITGNTVNEGAAFAPFQLNQTEPPSPEVLQQGLSMLACGVTNEVHLRARHGLPTYRYLFAGNFSNITPRPWLGAMHSSELPIIFGTHYQFRGNSTELEWQTSYSMESLWVSFAQNASRNPLDRSTGITWPKYSPCGQMIVFGRDDKAAQLVAGDSNDVAYMCSPSTQGPTRRGLRRSLSV